nr:uncharacterized protein LOC127315688 [Lolium perenne]
MDGGERAKKPILSEMTSHSVTSDIPDNKMDVGEGTKKRMLCEMTSKSVCSDIPDDKKHRVEENSILSDDKGEMACQSFKPPTPPCLLSMETDAAGPGTDEPIPGIIVPHEEGCGLGLPPAVETGGAAGAASVEPLVNGVVPREFSELEQNGLPIVKTDLTGADAGVATDDPAPEGGFVLVEPVMTIEKEYENKHYWAGRYYRERYRPKYRTPSVVYWIASGTRPPRSAPAPAWAAAHLLAQPHRSTSPRPSQPRPCPALGRPRLSWAQQPPPLARPTELRTHALPPARCAPRSRSLHAASLAHAQATLAGRSLPVQESFLARSPHALTRTPGRPYGSHPQR